MDEDTERAEWQGLVAGNWRRQMIRQLDGSIEVYKVNTITRARILLERRPPPNTERSNG